MSRWYRAYEGTVSDAKLGEVAMVAECSRSVAIAAWHCVLESAAAANDSGRFDTTPRRVAVILGEAPVLIERVFCELQALGMIEGSTLTAWSRRQYESDSSTERSRKHRNGKRNGDATLQQQPATPPETETETEEDIGADAPISPEPAKAAPRAVSPVVFELPCTSGETQPISEADVAEWRASFPAVDVMQQLAAMRAWLDVNPTKRKTRRGAKRFIVSWLDRRQNSGSAAQPRAGYPPPGKRMNAVEANLSLREPIHEPASSRRHNGNAELLPPNSPRLQGLVDDLGRSLSWPDRQGHH